MMAPMKIVLALLLFPALSFSAEPVRPAFDSLFHAGLDADLEAAVPSAISFVEGKVGKAASFGEGQFAEFHNLPKLDLHSATLEFWVKPDFERAEPVDRFFLRLLSPDGKSGLDCFFSQANCGFKAVMTAGPRKSDVAADYAFQPRKWNQVVLTWETGEGPLSGLRLYINGAMLAFLPSFTLMPPPATLRLGCKSKEEGAFAHAAIDEVSIYSRCLTELQVLDLYRNVALGPQRVELLRKRIVADDAAAASRMAEFLKNHKMAMIVGRTVGGLHDDFFKSIGLPPPDRIHEKDFETADLTKYDLLFFPGGGGYVFTEKAQQRLRDFLTNGGGYVGICAGACAALDFKLVDCNYFSFRERGLAEVHLMPHPITDGYAPDRRMWLSHYNGPFIEPSKDVQVVVMYNSGPPYAAIVVKSYGKGRVVVISPHPEAQSDSRPLVLNSFLWASHVLAPDPKP